MSIRKKYNMVLIINLLIILIILIGIIIFSKAYFSGKF